MPLLGGLFVNLFSGVVAWLGAYVTRKVAFAVAAVATYTTLTAALYVTFRGLVAAIEAQLTGIPAMLFSGVQLGVPPVASFCLGTYMTMWTACTVYTWQRDLLYLAMKA